MTIETLANIISVLAICISLAGVALYIYGRVQERRVAAAIVAARTIPPRTPPLMKNRGARTDEEVDERMRVTREEMAKEYRQKLTEQVKAVGQELIDRADDLVGNGGSISDFAIVLYFEQNSMPKIKLLREHLSVRCIDMEVQKGKNDGTDDGDC